MAHTIDIAISIDQSYLQHAGVMLCSLFENNRNHHFNIHVLVDTVAFYKKRKLTRVVKKYGHFINWIKVNTSSIASLKIHLHASIANYYRLLLPDLLPNVSRILYLDADIVFKTDIADLWQINLQKFPVAAVQEFAYDASYLDFAPNDAYLNSGVLLMNLEYWRKNEISIRVVDFVMKNPDKIKMWDQDGINVILKGQWRKMSDKWNQTSIVFDIFPNTFPTVIHYTGTLKPWHYHCQHPLKEEYFYYLKKTPWKNFSFKEGTRWHHVKQAIKRTINHLARRPVFELYV